ncbi:cell division protein FtsX [Pelistega europaea]|uniref:Cell division protein FtsX n=1 Tax=Pelistega europaea TaxID=106147 RepID=A0A7Y4L9B1_9BURK|nr:ABC transporter permease [Pelistega europaea]NOL49314.1 ABC transporter permease [Pelistega europaea]
MKTWLRHHLYAIRTALRRLLLTPFSTITNITVIAFVLSLPLVVSAILTSLAPVAKTVSVNPVITLFMKNNVSLEATQQLAAQIKTESNAQIDHITVMSKQEALDTLRSSQEWKESLDVLPNNPLPHSIIIALSNGVSTLQANEIAQQWQNNPEVDLVQFDRDWLKKLESIISFFKVLLGIFAVGVAIIVVATIFNTVRMQALLQRDEIAVARLVGATESFVRRPFLYLGIITGFCAGLLSIALTAIGLSLMNNAILVVAESYGQPFNLALPHAFWIVLAIVIVMIIAAIAARWSVTRHSSF